MMAYLDALKKMRELGDRLQLENDLVSVEDAPGRVLARSLQSPEAVPAFDNSAMDGFAVHAAATTGTSSERPVFLKVIRTVVAGDFVERSDACGMQQGWAVEIMTGAPVPQGYDAVIRVEDTHREGDLVWIRKAVSAGENIRKSGTDFSVGQKLMQAGQWIRSADVLSLASLGHAWVPVFRKIRVSVLSTGRELVSPETKNLSGGMIRNSTGPFLMSWLKRFGSLIEARFLGVVSDKPQHFERILMNEMESGTDVIVTTGAVSMGIHDFVGESLHRLGARTYFHQCAIRPAKPVLVAELREGAGPVVLAMPGNPVSTAVVARFFLDPMLRAALRMPEEKPRVARLLSPILKPKGLRCFYKGVLAQEGSELQANILHGQESYKVSPLLEADHWVVLPEETQALSSGDRVEVFSLESF